MSAEDLERSYGNVILPPDVIADLDASTFVTGSIVKYDAYGRTDELATMRNEGARVFWMRFRDRVAAAKRPRPEATPTHATSSTARPKS